MTTIERAPMDREEHRSDAPLAEQVAQLQLNTTGKPLRLDSSVCVRRRWSVPEAYGQDVTFITCRVSAAPDDSIVLHDFQDGALVLNRDGSTRAQLHTTKGDFTQKHIAPNNELIELCTYSKFGPWFRGNTVATRSLDGRLRRGFLLDALGSVVKGPVVRTQRDESVQVNRMVVDQYNNYHVVFADAEDPTVCHGRLNCARIVSMTSDGLHLRTIEVVPPTNVTHMVACGDYLVLLAGHWLSGASKPVDNLLVYALDGTLVHSTAPDFTIAGHRLFYVHAFACDQAGNLVVSFVPALPADPRYDPYDVAVVDVATLTVLSVVSSPRPVHAMAVDRHNHLLCLDWPARTVYELY